MRPLVFAFILSSALSSAQLASKELQLDLHNLTAGFKGRVGVCVQADTKPVCVNGDQRYSIQSVVKMLVSMAVLDAVDHKGWKLDTRIRIFNKDRSLSAQPIADKIGPNGYETTIDELIRFTTNESDSLACDLLIERLGGTAVVQDFLKRKGIEGIRIDRNERDLQTEVVGLKWRPEFTDSKVLDDATKAVPEARRDQAYRNYVKDPRDTATPVGMVQLLQKLVQGKLLSQASTKYYLSVMEQTATGTDRLKAGLKPGWVLGHKTGTSSTWKGLAAATNDVGFFRSPTGKLITIAVFVGDSTETPERRAAIIADIARTTLRLYHQ